MDSTEMMRRIRTAIMLASVIALMICATVPAWAGRGDKSGTAGAVELLIPVGSRASALAGASLATSSGIESMFWNPAGLPRASSKLEAMFSHTTYLAGIGVEYFALSGALTDEIGAGIHMKSLSTGEIAVTTEDMPDGTGERTSPTFLVAGATFARKISDRISVGLSADYVYEQMADVSASTIAFTGGVQYQGLGGIEGLAVGVVVRNIGPGIKYDGPGLERTVAVDDALRDGATLKIEAAEADLPTTIEIGLSYAMQMNSMGVMNFESSFNNNNFSDDEYKLGVEYVFDGRFALRGGYSFSSVDEGLEYLYGFSGGVGVRTKLSGVDVSIDYAYRSVKYFEGNHFIGLIVGM